MRDPILSVRDLTTTFRTESGVFPAVDGVSVRQQFRHLGHWF